jgi:hypothetical protein
MGSRAEDVGGLENVDLQQARIGHATPVRFLSPSSTSLPDPYHVRATQTYPCAWTSIDPFGEETGGVWEEPEMSSAPQNPFLLMITSVTDLHQWSPLAKEIEESPRESDSTLVGRACPRS